MSREQSDSEYSVVETGSDWFIDATTETEMEQGLPLKQVYILVYILKCIMTMI